MQSVLSTALSRLNSFLDSELEQILCFDTAIDAEMFCKQKTAVFLVMPEEDSNFSCHAGGGQYQILYYLSDFVAALQRNPCGSG